SDDGSLVAALRFSHGERNEQHSAKAIPQPTPREEFEVNKRNNEEKTKDNLSIRTTLAGLLQVPMSPSDKLFFSGAASILRYDTPSDQNVEDRDELLVALSLATTHRISQYFDLGISLEGTLSHIVYLLRERSANNNYNRVLR